MAEYIEVSSLWKCETCFYHQGGKCHPRVWCESGEAYRPDYRKLQFADVAPVVRCKECKHWHEELGWCDRHSNFVDADGEFCHPWESTEWETFDADYFCKDGERRSDNA